MFIVITHCRCRFQCVVIVLPLLLLFIIIIVSTIIIIITHILLLIIILKNISLSVENLELLSSRQALADLAHFIATIR